MRLFQPSCGQQSLKLAEDEAYLIAVQRWFSAPLLGDKQAWAGRVAGYTPSAPVGGAPVLSVPKLVGTEAADLGGRECKSSTQSSSGGQAAVRAHISARRVAAVCPCSQGQFQSKGLWKLTGRLETRGKAAG